jgi:hypothetical protein
MTRIMEGVQIVSLAEGLISAKKQQGRFALDLTARGVSRVESGGALDFGGSAFREASAIALEPQKKTPEEPYGWWNLEPGAYLLAFNETVRSAGAGLILVFPHRRLLAAGAWHASAVLDVLDHDFCVPLDVGPGGLAIKQNARVSRVIVLAEVLP